MNTLILYLDQLSDGKHQIKHGIHFCDVAIVKAAIDGEDIDENEYFKDSLIYFDELKKSKLGTGRYLIFTCACGIAEDGGWEGGKVEINDTIVCWKIEMWNETLQYFFDREQYEHEIDSMNEHLGRCGLPLEPLNVIFPENFSRSM